MNRNQFLKTAGLASLGLTLFEQSVASRNSGSPLKLDTAQDLNTFLQSLIELRQPSVDRIIIGDPQIKIKAIGTCWFPDWQTLKRAVDMGINVIVTHEPTFYTHWDLEGVKDDYYKAPEHAKRQYLELVNQKRQWILDQKLTIIRCHDVIDRLHKIGMPFALGNLLGFGEQNIKNKTEYYNVYHVEKARAIDLAKSFAARLKAIHQPGVGFYGDENRMVSSVGVGTGYICDPLEFSHMEPDLYMVINDTIKTWIQGAFSNDSGKPMIVIDHGVAEENGMNLLSQFLIDQFQDKRILHLAQGCSYKWVS